MARHFKQGYYTPKNPDKYVGDITKIRYMSSWELELHKFFDGNPNVIRWASEEIAIPYYKPTDGRIHKYYPDYWVNFALNPGISCRRSLSVNQLSKHAILAREQSTTCMSRQL